VTPPEQYENGWSDATCDLVAVVRSAYTLVFKQQPSSPDFWEKAFRVGSVWHTALELAIQQDYQNLGHLLNKLK
jgi:hypothetical protein